MTDTWQSINFFVPITEAVKDAASGDFLIRGRAINATTTRNRTRFLAEELQVSAASLRDKPLLKDHNNSVDSIVGRTTQNVTYDSTQEAVMFEAKVVDEPLQKKIAAGLVKNVSIGAMLKDLEAIKDENGDIEAFVARGIDFVELSLVAVPADPNADFAKACMESFDRKHKQHIAELTTGSSTTLTSGKTFITASLNASGSTAQAGSYKCSECSQSFPSQSALDAHMEDAHDMEPDDDGDETQNAVGHVKKFKLKLSKVEEAAQMAEETKTIEALREERLKLEADVEAMKVAALTAEKAMLEAKAKASATTATENKTVGEIAPATAATEQASNGLYQFALSKGKLEMTANLHEMKGTRFDHGLQRENTAIAQALSGRGA